MENTLQGEAKAELAPVDVAVIGAGIAGLSAAVYARLSGLSVRVFEKHTIPGGLCTSWKRKGYVFDYSIQYIVGTSRFQGFHDIWKDLGVIDRTEFQHIDTFGRFVGPCGKVFNLYTDYRRLQDHMLELAPEDGRMIRKLCKAIHKARHISMNEMDFSPKGIYRLVRSIPSIPTIYKWTKISVRQWCEGLKNSFLREAIPPLIGPFDFQWSGPILFFALMNRGAAAYPLGGSLPLAKAVEDRAKSLGAEFLYGNGARRVIIENGRAVGIELEDGRIQRARHVVAACDARAAFDNLIEGRVKDATYEAMFKRREIQPCIIQVSLGVKPDPAWSLQNIPNYAFYSVSKPIVIDGRQRSLVHLINYANDPKMAPEGRTALLVRYTGDYDSWEKLHADAAAYKAEKTRVRADTIQALEEHFPGIAKRVEASDVATPMSCVRYTNNWRGSMQGWILTPELTKKAFSGDRPPKTFPGVEGFHLIGQWTEPGGGTPPAAKSGRDVIRAIMKAEGKKAASRSVSPGSVNLFSVGGIGAWIACLIDRFAK